MDATEFSFPGLRIYTICAFLFDGHSMGVKRRRLLLFFSVRVYGQGSGLEAQWHERAWMLGILKSACFSFSPFWIGKIDEV
jgi:hypothetical protein